MTDAPTPPNADWQVAARAYLDAAALAEYRAWRDALPAPARQRHVRSLTQTVKGSPPAWPGPDEGLRMMVDALGRNDEAAFKDLRYRRAVLGIKDHLS